MPLTRRGLAVLGVAIAGVVLAGAFGARSLNAVVLPALVALLAGHLQLRGRESLSATRDVPADGFVGETRQVELAFAEVDGSPIERPFPGVVHERVGDGLSVTAAGDDDDRAASHEGEARFDVAVGADPVTYEVAYDDRGERTLGPATVVARDVLGLFERELRVPGRDSVLVYPEVYRLTAWGRQYLTSLEDLGRSQQREEFESLREYAPGDSLRDVHWRTTAKRDELIVQEFAAEVEAEAVTMSGGGDPERADELAAALASISLALFEEGIPVSLSVPLGTVDAGPERGNVVRLFELLARTGAGRPRDPDADVVVRADVDEPITIAIGDHTVTFDELVGEGAPTVQSTDAVEVGP